MNFIGKMNLLLGDSCYWEFNGIKIHGISAFSKNDNIVHLIIHGLEFRFG